MKCIRIIKILLYKFNMLSDNKDELEIINVNLQQYFEAPHL